MYYIVYIHVFLAAPITIDSTFIFITAICIQKLYIVPSKIHLELFPSSQTGSIFHLQSAGRVNIAPLFVTQLYKHSQTLGITLQAHLYKLKETLTARDRHVTPAQYLPSGAASRTVCHLHATQCTQ